MHVTQIRVSKVLSSAGVSNAGLWSAMNAEEIPSKPTLHPAFLDALHALWRQAGACASHTLPPENPRVLDLGCGDGRLALSLVEEAATWGVGVEWVGTDVCGNAVKCARRLAHNAGYSPVDAAPPAQSQLSASEQQRRPRPRAAAAGRSCGCGRGLWPQPRPSIGLLNPGPRFIKPRWRLRKRNRRCPISNVGQWTATSFILRSICL